MIRGVSNMVNLGERLRALRNEKRITQTEMSRRTGITPVMISSYELEQRQPSFETLIKLAAFFGTTTDYLLGIERGRTVNIEGLTEHESEAISNMIEILKKRK
jgi:transcriptional regulator with XRE-family HTH domain